MYLYLYDYLLSSKKYIKTLARIETRLTDLGIGGKISRLSPLKNIKELVRDEIANGVKTIVAVGNDKTVMQVINEVASYNVALGIIPIGPDNKIAQALGIPLAEAACDVLSARALERIDLGKANNTYFLSEITIQSGKVILNCEHKYRIKPAANFRINICNLRPAFMGSAGQPRFFNPSDGFFEALIYPVTIISRIFNRLGNSGSNSIVPFRKLQISSEDSVAVITDGHKVLKTPVEIEVIPQKLKIIVGKKRVF